MVNSGSSANLVMISALKKYYGWEEDDGYIVKRYQFEDWKKITKFMKAITDLIVKENHHPQLVLDSLHLLCT